MKSMYVFSVFELSSKLEEAVTALQTKGIAKTAILAVPLNSRNESERMFDTVHYSDNAASLAFTFILAMMGTLFGSIYGFQLTWGPIIWGFSGALIGGAVGLGATLIRAYFRKRRQQRAHKENVIVIVSCDPSQSDAVQEILWSNTALGVNTL